MKTIFLGGPIRNAIDKDNRFDCKLHELIVRLLADLENSGFLVRSAHREEDFGRIAFDGRSPIVATRDFEWVSSSDIFVAVLPPGSSNQPLRTDGTYVEIGWATALRKPVILVTSEAASYGHIIDGLPSVAMVKTIPYEAVLENPNLLTQTALALRVHLEGTEQAEARRMAQTSLT